MKDKSEIESLLLAIIKQFTRFHDALHLKSVLTPRSVNFTLTAHSDDVGKLIGGQGIMVNALKTILQKLADSLQMRSTLNISEPTEGRKLPQDPFKVDRSYVPTAEAALLKRIGQFVYNDGATVRVVDLDGESSTLVLTMDSESGVVDTEFEAALSNVFRAIGKAKGRKLYVELDNTLKG